MPELPEVEAARALIAANCEGKRILKATIGDDSKVMPDPKAELQASLEGKTVYRALRKGKHLWLDLGSGNRAILFHFGMTGGMVVKGVKSVNYKRFVVGDEEWPPRFTKIELDLEGGVQAAFYDARRFGKVRLVLDPEHNEPISKLGFDCLLGMPTLEDFSARLTKKSKGVKALLLDQAFCAGVGNWVADEVLYQAAIHPEQKASTLTPDQVAALHDKMHSVVKTACDAGADDEQYPRSWLFHTKWKKTGKAGDEPVYLDGNLVKYEDMAGRSTAWVPAVQKLLPGTADGPGKNAKKAAASPRGAKKRKAASPEDEADEEGEEEEPAPAAKKQKKGKGRGARKAAAKEPSGDEAPEGKDEESDEGTKARKPRARGAAAKGGGKAAKAAKEAEQGPGGESGSRSKARGKKGRQSPKEELKTLAAKAKAKTRGK